MVEVAFYPLPLFWVDGRSRFLPSTGHVTCVTVIGLYTTSGLVRSQVDTWIVTERSVKITKQESISEQIF